MYLEDRKSAARSRSVGIFIYLDNKFEDNVYINVTVSAAAAGAQARSSRSNLYSRWKLLFFPGQPTLSFSSVKEKKSISIFVSWSKGISCSSMTILSGSDCWELFKPSPALWAHRGNQLPAHNQPLAQEVLKMKTSSCRAQRISMYIYIYQSRIR